MPPETGRRAPGEDTLRERCFRKHRLVGWIAGLGIAAACLAAETVPAEEPRIVYRGGVETRPELDRLDGADTRRELDQHAGGDTFEVLDGSLAPSTSGSSVLYRSPVNAQDFSTTGNYVDLGGGKLPFDYECATVTYGGHLGHDLLIGDLLRSAQRALRVRRRRRFQRAGLEAWIRLETGSPVQHLRLPPLHPPRRAAGAPRPAGV